MKTILIKALLILSIISFSGISYLSNTYAADWVKVTVTEEIPGAGCNSITSDADIKAWKTEMYECTIKKWFGSVIEMMWNIIKYFTFIASLWSVLFIIINGILYSMWGAEPSMKDDAKKRIMWTLTWLALLLLSWVILNMVAPWIYK